MVTGNWKIFRKMAILIFKIFVYCLQKAGYHLKAGVASIKTY